MKSDEAPPRLPFDPALSRLVGALNRMAQGEPTPTSTTATVVSATPPDRGTPPAELQPLLEAAVRSSAADLLIVSGAPPVLRIESRLERLGDVALDGEAIRSLLLPLLGRRNREALATRRAADFAFDAPGVGRFRANVHYEMGRLGACLRLLPAAIPRLETLGLPPAVTRLADLTSGLVLVGGPPGAGKTTTLAALLARILAERPVHAITIEEPVEYLHGHGQALVEQVEVPYDAPSFAEALRSALRQSPDVVLVGELRDPETMAAALTAAETGQLVLASCHCHTAAQAIHRVLDAFPAGQQEQARKQLATTLAAVVAQRLLPRADGTGRVAAAELMLATDAVRNLIREGRVHQLSQAIALRRGDGMITLEASLAALVGKGVVARAAAERVAYYPEELGQLLS